MIPDPSPPFEFSSLGRARESILQIMARARLIGLGATAENWFRHMEFELRYHPRSWGDPIRNLRGLQQVQYRGIISPLIAYYSVHERAPIVVLGDVVAKPDHPLAQSL